MMMTPGRTLALLVLLIALIFGSYAVLTDPPDGAAPQEAAPEESPDTMRSEAPEKKRVLALAGRPVPDAPLDDGEAGIHGRVLDARDGSPVGGVLIVAWGRLPKQPDYSVAQYTLASATSGTDGTFRLRLVTGWTVRVVAVGGGWVNAETAEEDFSWWVQHRWRCGRDREKHWVAHDVRVLPAGRVEGRVVLPDGRALPGASVRPLGYEVEPVTLPYYPWAAIPEVRCDSEGRFVLDNVPGARGLYLIARHDGHGEGFSEPFDVTLGATTTVDVRFPVNRNLRFDLVDAASKEPVEGAAISAAWPQRGSEETHPQRRRRWTAVTREAVTDARGSATLRGLPKQAIQLTIRADGYLPIKTERNAWDEILEASRRPGDVARIELTRGRWITGKIDCLEHVQGPWLPVECEALDAPAYADFKASTHTGEGGAFRIFAPPTGTYRLSTYLHGHEWSLSGKADAEAGAVDVVLPGLIHGRQRPKKDARPKWHVRVLGPAGERVRWVGINSPASGWTARGTQAEDCQVTLVVDHDEKGVWLSLYGGVTLEGAYLGGTVCGPFDASGGELDVRLPAEAVVCGRVLDVQGVGVQGAEVKAWPERPDGWPAAQQHSWHISAWTHGDAITDADGRFEIRGLGAGRYLVSVGKLGALRPPAPVTVRAGGEDVTLRMIAAVTHHVRVLGAEGEPVVGARVTVGQTDGVQGPSSGCTVQAYETDEHGVAVIPDLEPGGTYRLGIRDAHPYADGDLNRLFTASQKQREHVIRLERRYEVRGVVVDEDDRPLHSIHVYLKEAGGNIERKKTGLGGTFTFDDLKPGAVRLAAVFRKGYGGWNPPESFPVTARAGATDVVIKLASRRDLTVVFDATPAQDEMPTSYYLTALDGRPESERRKEYVSMRRPARVRDLEPGMKYRLWAGPSENGWYLLADIGGEDTTVHVLLRKGATLRGRLLLPPDATRASVRITAHGLYLGATVDVRHGRFELRGLPDGTWTLGGGCSIGDARRWKTLQVRPGDAPEIDLTKP